LKEYNLKSSIPELMLESRLNGAQTFYERDPMTLQEECLQFGLELLIRIKSININL
jgi:hypothetical protein